MTKVAGYVRVSTDKQKENDSHVRQRERLEKWADLNDYDIDIYQDIAISGQSTERDDYRELMGDPSSDDLGDLEEYDVFVVREMSRMGRSLQRVTKDIELMGEKGIEFVSLKEDIDMTSAQGKLMLHIIAGFNQFWADWARERAEEYVEQAREDGLPLGRPKKLNEEQLEEVYHWREKGLSYNNISILIRDVYGVSVDGSTIYRYCKEEGVEPEVSA